MGLKIVDFEAHHLHLVYSIERRVFHSPWSREAFRHELSRPGARGLVAVMGGEVMGYACFRVKGGKGYILNLATHPDKFRQGIASRLVGGMLDRMRADNAATVRLELRASNSEALALYEAFGFVETGQNKGYYTAPRESATLMSLKL